MFLAKIYAREYNLTMEKHISLMKKAWDNRDGEFDIYHVDVVDGIRGFSVLLVLWFHFWQQTWLMPSYILPGILGSSEINLTPVHIRWVGYLFVDMMVLLSSFCLFLPVARNILTGEKNDTPLTFYKKRFARIYPCYLIFVIIGFGLSLYSHEYGSVSLAMRDLISHLTFTNLFRIDTYVFSKINVALWTVSLEAQFYFVFPLFARLFKKNALLTYCILLGLGIAFIYGYGIKSETVSMAVNQFPAFLPVFANGFLTAFLFTLYQSKCHCKRLLSVPFTAVALLAAVIIWKMLVSCYSFTGDKQIWQLRNRCGLSFAFSLFVFSSACSVKSFRFLFSNHVARFFGDISFNLYMCHQRIMVRLVRTLGFGSGADVTAAGSKMQWMLTGEALVLSILVAVFMTYVIEKPFRKALLACWS